MRFQLIIDPKAEELVTATLHRPSVFTAKLEALVRSHDGTDRIAAFGEDEILLLSFSQIECVTVIGGKTCAIDRQGRQYRLKQRLCELEEILPSSFIRVNKSTLANEMHIDRFAAAFSGAVDVVFRCGYRDYVSRLCFAQLKRRFCIK